MNTLNFSQNASYFNFFVKTLLLIILDFSIVGIVLAEQPVVYADTNINKILPSDVAAEDKFGTSVAILGDMAVIGAPFDDDKGDNSGSVYVYARDENGVWGEQAKLVADDGASGDLFGWSVAISENAVVIGASNDKNDNSSGSGSVYIFARDGNRGGWVQQSKLVPDDGASRFGNSVSISGDTVVAGAVGGNYDNSGNGVEPYTGSAYVYARDENSEWSQQAKFVDDDPERAELGFGLHPNLFGSSVSISGNTAVIGAPSSGALASYSATAFIFVRNEQGIWSLKTKLRREDVIFFGKSVSISGDTMVIGGFPPLSWHCCAQSAYVFVRDSDGEWIEQGRLDPGSNNSVNNNFGRSVSISGDTVVVGAEIFVRDSSGNWVKRVELDAEQHWVSNGSYTGVAAISSNTVIIGASEEGGNATRAGSVYMFDLTGISENCGKGIELDGSNDILSIASSSLTPNFTIEAWVKLAPGIDNKDALFGGHSRESDFNFEGGRARLYIDGDRVISDTVLLADTWYHIAITRQNSDLTLYINGMKDATGTWDGEIDAGIFGRGRYGFFKGMMDEIRVWTITRTEAEIKANYNKDIDYDTSGLFVYHNLNGSGQRITDVYYNANIHGSLGANREVGSDDPVRKVSMAPFTETCKGLNFGDNSNTAPVAHDDTIDSVEIGGTTSFTVTKNDVDSDGTIKKDSLVIVSEPNAGTIEIDYETGKITYIHDGSVMSNDSFIYTVEDDEGNVSNEAIVTIIINDSVTSCGGVGFDGANDWINIPDLTLTNDFTIEGWFNLAPSIDYRDALFGQEGSGPDIHFSAGRVRLYAYGIRVTAKTPLIADTWGHIAITRSGSNLTVYVNGVKDATGRWNGLLSIKAIGRGNRGYFKGMMDEIRIWELARTEEEISNSFEENVDPNSAGLIGYWGFNNTDQIITDASNSGNDGSLGANTAAGTDDPIRLVSTAPLNENCDGGTGSNAPIANNDIVEPVVVGGTVSFSVTENDVDIDDDLDPASVSIISAPSDGSAAVNADGTITYVSTGTIATTDTLTYTVADSGGLVSNEATVTIMVKEPNLSPVANDDIVGSVDVGEIISFTVTDNDEDIDGDLNLTSVVIVSDPSDGTASVDASGAITYLHTGNIETTDMLSYTVADTEGAISNIATVTITVIDDNTPPTAQNDIAGPVEAGGTITFSVIDNDVASNANLNPASISIVSTPIDGNATANSDGTITYVNSGSAAVTDILSYTVADVEGKVSNEATVTITVTEPPFTDETITKLLASDGSAGDKFGSSVSISGGIAIIGSPYDDDNGDSSGSAYVFIRNSNGNWNQQAKLLANDGSSLDYFGNSVSISGDTALIGSHHDDDNGNSSGSAYVFIRDSSGNWIQQAKLLANDGSAIDYFGESVSISEDIALIGSHGVDDQGNSGAYVFIRDSSGNWSQEAKLLTGDESEQNVSSDSVSISGNTALIGSYRNDSAYVFVRDNNGNWSLQTKLLANDGSPGDLFGWSVSISGDSAVISSNFDDDKGDYSGSAYIFVRDSNGLWNQQAKLLDENGSAGDGFGVSVSISGRAVVIGSAYPDENPYSNKIHVYIQNSSGNWDQQTTILPDYIFGIVSISENTAIIGSPDGNENDNSSGSFYILTPLDSSDLIIPTITLNESSIVNLLVGDTYIESGAIATDDVDGEINDQIIIDNSEVNTASAGIYTVTYNVSDTAGNAAEEVIRTIVVEQPIVGDCRMGLELDGSNDWVNIPNLTLPNDFTIEGWFKLAPGIDYRDALFGQEGSGPDIHFTGGKVRLYAYGIRVTANTPVVADTWSHIAITRSGTNLTVYINGVKDAIGRWNGLLSIKAIGRGNRGYFKGIMDEIRIWNVARTDVEIGASYGITVDSNATGLIGNWNFNEADQIITDASSFANHGSLGASTVDGTDDPIRLDSTAPLSENCDGDVVEPPTAPIANNDTVGSVEVGGTISFSVTDNDVDSDGNLDPASVLIVSDPSEGDATVNADGTITYVNTGSTETTDMLSYTVADTEGGVSNEATVTIVIVASPPTPPIANADTATVQKGEAVIIDVLSNDSDSDGSLDTSSLFIVSDPGAGTVDIDIVTGEITYTHDGSATTDDSFIYTIQDDQGDVSNEAIVSITIIDSPTPSDNPTFYISTTGNDSNPGTVNEPFKTLEQARSAVAAYKQSSGLPDQGIAVILREGVYQLGQSFNLGSADSGAQGKPIVYQSEANETATITGSQPLDPTKFSVVDSSSAIWNRLDDAAKSNVLQIDLGGEGISNFGVMEPRNVSSNKKGTLHLYFDNKPMTLARWPDKPTEDSPKNHNISENGFTNINQALSNTAFTYTNDRADRWTQANDIWLHGFFKFHWADYHVPVTNLDTNSKTMTVIQPGSLGIGDGQPFYAYNLLEEITEPGEWYLDRTSGILYFWPPADINSKNISVSMMDTTLIELNNASWITFKDIVIEGGRDGLIKMTGGSHNEIQNSILRNSGSVAAIIDATESGIEDSEIAYTGDGGIIVKGGNRVTLQRADNFIRNNKIHHFGQWVYGYKGGIKIEGIGQTISNNTLYQSPHVAIQWEGNEHLIEKNEMHDVVRFASDMGAMYSGRNWGWRGNVVKNNFIHDIYSWAKQADYEAHGVYLDDALSGTTVFGNIFYQIHGFGILNGGGRDNILENNVFAYCGVPLLTDNRAVNALNFIQGNSWNLIGRIVNDGIDYKTEPWASKYPELAEIPTTFATQDPSVRWLYPEGSVFKSNISFGGNPDTRVVNGIFDLDRTIPPVNSPISYFEEVSNNIDGQDPLFVNEGSLDLNLQPSSPAFSIPGFQAIPFDQIGVQ